MNYERSLAKTLEANENNGELRRNLGIGSSLALVVTICIILILMMIASQLLIWFVWKSRRNRSNSINKLFSLLIVI